MKSQKVNWDKIVWSPGVLPKFRFCLWLEWRNALKTRMMLHRRGVEIDLKCEFCHQQNEYRAHLFFVCEFTKEIWKKVPRNAGIHREPLTWEDESRWIRRATRGKSNRSRKIKLALSSVAYHIWQERNWRFFRQKERDSDALTCAILQFCCSG